MSRAHRGTGLAKCQSSARVLLPSLSWRRDPVHAWAGSVSEIGKALTPFGGATGEPIRVRTEIINLLLEVQLIRGVGKEDALAYRISLHCGYHQFSPVPSPSFPPLVLSISH